MSDASMMSILRSSIIQLVTDNRYRKEITLILILKVLGLFLLWWLFFSHPLAGRLTNDAMAQHWGNNASVG